MLLHNQPRFLAELQGDVVSRDKEILPANTGPTGRMQKRSAIYVSGRDLSQLLPRPQSLCKVSHLPAGDRKDSSGVLLTKLNLIWIRNAASVPAFFGRSWISISIRQLTVVSYRSWSLNEMKCPYSACYWFTSQSSLCICDHLICFVSRV